MDASIAKFLPLKEIHVLVVDADEVSRSLLERLLLYCNYQVTAIDDVKKAWSLLINGRNNKFDIAMVDVRQSEAEGPDFIKTAINMGMFTIQISATPDHLLLKEERVEGADMFLHKPIRVDTVFLLWQQLFVKIIRRKDYIKHICNKSDHVSEISSNESCNELEMSLKEEVDDHNKKMGVTNEDLPNKKMRISWKDGDLNERFVMALHTLGGIDSKDSTPTRIREVMNAADEVTMPQIASHLQKLHRTKVTGTPLNQQANLTYKKFLVKEEEDMDANMVKFEPQKETHILLIDVDPVSRKSLEETLLICNYQVTAVEDVDKGLILFNAVERNTKFDIAMLDVHQPSGFLFIELAAMMEIYTIHISDVYDDELLKEALVHGVDSSMAKPIGLDNVRHLWQHVFHNTKYPIKGTRIANFDLNRKQIHVLLVDADHRHRRCLAKLLRTSNYQVTEAEDAKKASSILEIESNDFEIVIVDVHPQEAKGFDFIDKATEIGIYTIHISAADNVTLVEEGRSRGANLFIMKPVRLDIVRCLWQHASQMNKST